MKHEDMKHEARALDVAFVRAAYDVLDKGLRKITHCLDQLKDDEIWKRPRPEMNSIANVLIHLSGNLRQWILSGVGGAPDTRNRPAEFSDRSMRPKKQLIDDLEQVVKQCEQVLAKTSASALLETRRIQGFEEQLLSAILSTVSHFQGHVQEIIHMTRMIRGNEYKFDFVPKGKEQGGE
jgi:hypothetical protein